MQRDKTELHQFHKLISSHFGYLSLKKWKMSQNLLVTLTLVASFLLFSFLMSKSKRPLYMSFLLFLQYQKQNLHNHLRFGWRTKLIFYRYRSLCYNYRLRLLLLHHHRLLLLLRSYTLLWSYRLLLHSGACSWTLLNYLDGIKWKKGMRSSRPAW